MKRPYECLSCCVRILGCSLTQLCLDQGEDVIRVNVKNRVRLALSADDSPEGVKDVIIRCWDPRPDRRPSFGGIDLIISR